METWSFIESELLGLVGYRGVDSEKDRKRWLGLTSGLFLVALATGVVGLQIS